MIRLHGIGRDAILRASCFFALAGAAWAQIRGPVMGYLPDGGTLRTMSGIPPAGSVGGAITPAGAFSRLRRWRLRPTPAR
jgi:hypothetical protein